MQILKSIFKFYLYRTVLCSNYPCRVENEFNFFNSSRREKRSSDIPQWGGGFPFPGLDELISDVNGKEESSTHVYTKPTTMVSFDEKEPTTKQQNEIATNFEHTTLNQQTSDATSGHEKQGENSDSEQSSASSAALLMGTSSAENSVAGISGTWDSRTEASELGTSTAAKAEMATSSLTRTSNAAKNSSESLSNDRITEEKSSPLQDFQTSEAQLNKQTKQPIDITTESVKNVSELEKGSKLELPDVQIPSLTYHEHVGKTRSTTNVECASYVVLILWLARVFF